MPRKKVSDDVIDATNLSLDEEIVVKDERRIGKQKRAKPPEPPAEEINDDDGDEFELVGKNIFSEGTIASQLFNRAIGDDEEQEEKELAASLETGNVLVVRKPDSPTDRFAIPCTGRLSKAPLRNLDFANSTWQDIEEVVREVYGGGHYLLQIQIGSQMHTGRNVSLDDPPNFAAKIAAQNAPPAPAPLTPAEPPTPVNPLDSMLDSLAKMKLLKDALFGDAESALRQQIEDLKQEVRDAKQNQPPAHPQSESLALIEKALTVNNPTLQEKLLDAAFPSNDTHWLPDLVKTIFEHKEEVAGVLSTLIGGVAPRALPAGGVVGILQKQPPAGANGAPPPRSNFRRTAPPPEPAPAPPQPEVSTADSGKAAKDKTSQPEKTK